jgi:hypothetical protein
LVRIGDKAFIVRIHAVFPLEAVWLNGEGRDP